MPVLDPLCSDTRFAATRDTLRRIHDDVLPRSKRRIERSDASLATSIVRQFESTQRLGDADGE